MNLDRIVAQLREIGMSGYEAKAYLALLGAGRPLNGYEVAKASGVPRSTVYEALAKLVSRGAAYEVKLTDQGTGYLALPADSLIARLRREFETQIDALSASLPEVVAPAEASLIHNISGAVQLLDRARDLIESASDNLFVSVWPEEAEPLVPALRRAHRRGVEVSIISFGEIEHEGSLGHVYPHEFSHPNVVFERVGARLLIVAADRSGVLIGGVVNEHTWGVWSDDPAVVLMAVEYVRHDIAMQVLVDRIGTEEVEQLWKTDPALQRLQMGTEHAAAEAVPTRRRGRRSPPELAS